MGDILDDEGYEVFTFCSGTAALAEIERLQPHVVILDWLLNGEQVGVQVLQALRRNPRTAQVPVVVCTGAIEAAPQLQQFGADSVSLILKPFALDDLLTAVASALQAV